MAYQSRQRKYLSPREKNEAAWKNFKKIFWFALLAAAVWIFKNRLEYWAWIKTYFY